MHINASMHHSVNSGYLQGDTAGKNLLIRTAIRFAFASGAFASRRSDHTH